MATHDPAHDFHFSCATEWCDVHDRYGPSCWRPATHNVNREIATDQWVVEPFLCCEHFAELMGLTLKEP